MVDFFVPGLLKGARRVLLLCDKFQRRPQLSKDLVSAGALNQADAPVCINPPGADVLKQYYSEERNRNDPGPPKYLNSSTL